MSVVFCNATIKLLNILILRCLLSEVFSEMLLGYSGLVELLDSSKVVELLDSSKLVELVASS
jgi:hypothetical protein